MTLRVCDNGIGTEAGKREDVFERFVRSHPEHNRQQQVDGAGLGLAIVAESVDAMGGSIELDSAEGKGSTSRCTCRSNAPDRARV